MDTIFMKDHPPVRHEGGGCQGAGLGEGEVRFKGVLCHLMPWLIDLSEITFCGSSDLTGHNYVWIVTQSVIGESRNGVAPTKPQFPIGMLGKL